MSQFLFVSPQPLPNINQRIQNVKAVTCMSKGSSSGGFSKKPAQQKRPPSKAQLRRQAASQKYDEMAAEGMPEYSIWMRLKQGGVDDQEEQMPWLPVGCLAVPRSSQVSDVIFETEEDLMQGAIRLYPALQNEQRDNIEFGYQLREFDDEEIRIAERRVTTGWRGALSNFFGGVQNPLNPSK